MPGTIITVDSKMFIEKFIREEIMTDYQYLVISDAIKIADTNSIHKGRISILRSLMPTTKIRSLICNSGMTEYCNAYLQYLASPEIFPTMVTMVKAYLGGLDIVLICSDDEEKEMQILYIISQYLLNTFGVTAVTYDYYRKNKQKCRQIPDNLDDIYKVFEKAVEWAKTHRSEKQLRSEEEGMKDKLHEELKEMSSKELKKLCKELDIIYDKSMSKKEVRKAIIKKIIKRNRKQYKVEK
jgi:hypothetical protein